MAGPSPRELGERLASARKASGMKQKDVSAYLEVSTAMVCLWEKGDRNIDLDHLCKLADLYGYSVTALLGEQLDEKPVAMAFRAGNISGEVLEVIAWAKRFAMNLSSLGQVLEGPDNDA